MDADELKTTEIQTLIDSARQAGLRIEPKAGRLRITGPKAAAAFAHALRDRKVEVLQALLAISDDTEWKRKQNPVKAGGNEGSASSVPPVSAFTESEPFGVPGYFPCQPIIRNGIEHKREACNCHRGWRHVWGGTNCCDCWPCTDLKALVADAGEPT